MDKHQYRKHSNNEAYRLAIPGTTKNTTAYPSAKKSDKKKFMSKIQYELAN